MSNNLMDWTIAGTTLGAIVGWLASMSGFLTALSALAAIVLAGFRIWAEIEKRLK